MQPLGRNVFKAPAPAGKESHTHAKRGKCHVETRSPCFYIGTPWKFNKKTKNDGYIRMCVHLQLRGLATTSSATQEVHVSSMIF